MHPVQRPVNLRLVNLRPGDLFPAELRPGLRPVELRLARPRELATLPLLTLMRPSLASCCALLERRCLCTRSRPHTRGLRSKPLPGSTRLLPSRRVLRPLSRWEETS